MFTLRIDHDELAVTTAFSVYVLKLSNFQVYTPLIELQSTVAANLKRSHFVTAGHLLAS